MAGAVKEIRVTPEEHYAHLLNQQAELLTKIDRTLEMIAQQGVRIDALADAVAEVVTLAREARPLLESKWMTAMRGRLARGPAAGT